jgi:hypothetical protein
MNTVQTTELDSAPRVLNESEIQASLQKLKKQRKDLLKQKASPLLNQTQRTLV